MVLERVARFFGGSQVTSFWCFTGSQELATAASAAPPLASPNICYEITTPLNQAGPSTVTDVTKGISASVSGPAAPPVSPAESTGSAGLFVVEDTIKGDGSGTMCRIAQALACELINAGVGEYQDVGNLILTPLNLVKTPDASQKATTFTLCTGPGVTVSQVSQALGNNLLVGHWTGGDGRWEVSKSSAGQFTITWSAGEGATSS